MRIALALLFLTACSGHPSGAIEVTDQDCYACHRPDYEGTTDPDHQVEGFPTQCNQCHSTDAWSPALEGEHPENRFPIAHGRHSGIPCAQCHDPTMGSSANGANTSCIACHTHNKDDTDAHHGGVDDYRWDPDQPHNCLRCHPSGGAPIDD
jgi:hypothetical protein